MPKVSVSTQAAVEPEMVWQLAVALPRYAEWLTMHDAFTGDTPEILEEGTAYRQRVKLMGMPAEIAWRVTAAQAPGRLELTGDGPMGVTAYNRILIEAADGQGSLITLEMEFNGPALAGPMAGMVEKQARSGAEKSLANFTALLN